MKQKNGTSIDIVGLQNCIEKTAHLLCPFYPSIPIPCPLHSSLYSNTLSFPLLPIFQYPVLSTPPYIPMPSPFQGLLLPPIVFHSSAEVHTSLMHVNRDVLMCVHVHVWMVTTPITSLSWNLGHKNLLHTHKLTLKPFFTNKCHLKKGKISTCACSLLLAENLIRSTKRLELLITSSSVRMLGLGHFLVCLFDVLLSSSRPNMKVAPSPFCLNILWCFIRPRQALGTLHKLNLVFKFFVFCSSSMLLLSFSSDRALIFCVIWHSISLT